MNPKLFLFSLLFVFFNIPTFTTAATSLIQKTCTKCAQTDPNIAYTFCVTSLQAYPGSSCADLRKLGLISIKLTSKNVTDTKKYVKKLLKNRGLDSGARGCLSDCYELYSDAVPALKKAAKDYKSKHFDDADIEVSSVLDAASTCEDGFDEKQIVSPLKVRNNNTFQLSAIALSIINMVNS